MTYLANNNATSTLAGAVLSTDLSITLAAGQGARFPVVAAPDYTLVTLENAAGNREIVKVTARASGSDVMTVVRAQEGTTALAWNLGDVVSQRITAALVTASIAHPTVTTDAHAASAIQVTPVGNISSTDVQSALAELDAEKATAAAVASLTTTVSGKAASGANNDITSLGAMTEPFGFRNKLINGNFAVNQRAVSGTVTLAAGAYGHDRFKAGASGCTYTFATVNNVTTLTISAGSLMQIIEGLNLQSGTHKLSWTGTAQGRVDTGAYGASGVIGTAVGGTNQTCEWGAGTLSLVQYEKGSVATPFENRHIGLELSLCYRYYYLWPYYYMRFGAASLNNWTQQQPLPVTMRASPTVIIGSVTYYNGVIGNPITASAYRVDWNFNSSSAGDAFTTWTNYAFSAEL